MVDKDPDDNEQWERGENHPEKDYLRGDPNPTYAQQESATVTAMECAAMRLLDTDPGWTQKEISLAMNVSQPVVSRHVRGRCTVHARPDGHEPRSENHD